MANICSLVSSQQKNATLEISYSRGMVYVVLNGDINRMHQVKFTR